MWQCKWPVSSVFLLGCVMVSLYQILLGRVRSWLARPIVALCWRQVYLRRSYANGATAVDC